MRGFAAVGLVRPKSPFNIGGAMRAASVYGAAMVAIQGCRTRFTDPLDTTKAWRHIPVLLAEDLFDLQPTDSIRVAVDLVPGAHPLPRFCHPERAFYIFGPEDGTLGATILDRCHHRVMVPTRGCMNLAATVNVVLYDRMAKGTYATRRQLAEQRFVA
jgi:tRNA(Leu) C34 or U34 (ribose-2'-O)-methylase TrmL